MEIVAHQIDCDRRSEDSFALRMLTAFLLVSALMLGTGNLAHAAGAKEIGCGTPIDKPGQYRLVLDCVIPDGDFGVAIRADDVELDLDGHTISGSAAGCGQRSVGVSLGPLSPNDRVSNALITNGILKDLFVGIQASNADHNHFSKLTLVENCTGIALGESNENQVSYNDISRNIADGVLVQTSANHNHITFNVIDQNSSSTSAAGLGGVDLGAGADSNVVAFNEISGNLQSGITLLGGSQKNIVASNVVTENSTSNGYGIWVNDRSTHNFLVNNIAQGNGNFDLEDSNVDRPCDKNIWKGNIGTKRPALVACIP